jgi:FMN phosphatase YigB (HAD superfamily)/tRNA(Leu) C34 or U34 (ribose-2'-O)-methylase TrmL
VRDRLAEKIDHRTETLAALRRRSFRLALEELGVRDSVLSEELAACYFRHRYEELQLFADASEVIGQLADRYVLGLITNGNSDLDGSRLPGVFAFRLVADSIGIRKPDTRMFTMAAAAVPCRPAELVHVGDDLDKDVTAPRAAGARGVLLDRTGASRSANAVSNATITSLAELPAVIDALDAQAAANRGSVGVGPHPMPWPPDSHFDPDLLAQGDRRNVVDRYRYWRTEAVVADLDKRRHPFHVAIENWQHDLNIGTVVRNANAFLASSVRVVGRRRWNRRGAMVTDRYQHVEHHASIAELVTWAAREGLELVAIDNVPGALPIDRVELPRRCVLLFGQEGCGLSDEARQAAQLVCSIRQFGSTRSINAGVASGIAMHAWTSRYANRVDEQADADGQSPRR